MLSAHFNKESQATPVSLADALPVAGQAFTGEAVFIRPATTDAYTVGAAVGADGAAGAVHRLTNIAPVGSHIDIESLQLTMSGTALPSGMGGGFSLHFFTAEPIGIADNIAFDVDAVDRRIYAGYLDIGTLELIGGGFLSRTTVLATSKLRVRMLTTDLWAIIITAASNGFTPTPSAEFELLASGKVAGFDSLSAYFDTAPWRIEIITRKAKQLPAVSWRFAEDRSLTDRILGLTLLFTRPTFRLFNQANNTWDTVGIDEPAFSYLNGVSMGLDIWETRTNVFLNSDAPVTQDCTVTAVPWTLSFEGTGTITLTGASTAGPLVGTGANNRVQLTFTPSAGALTLTLSGSITEPQLELGTAASPPIRTKGLQTARAADICLTNDLSWYDPAGGVWYAEYIVPVSALATRQVFIASSSTGNNRAPSVVSGATGIQLTQVWSSNVVQAGLNSVPVTPGNPAKLAASVALNDVKVSVNGGTLLTDTTAALPIGINRLNIGSGVGGVTVLNSTIARLDYYPPGAAQSFIQRMTA
jgi:hypothetical protein